MRFGWLHTRPIRRGGVEGESNNAYVKWLGSILQTTCIREVREAERTGIPKVNLRSVFCRPWLGRDVHAGYLNTGERVLGVTLPYRVERERQ